jgi:hypothetical protein
MNKERKEFFTSKQKAGLTTNIQFVYALDSCMALMKETTANATKVSLCPLYAEVKITRTLQLTPTCVDKPPHYYVFTSSNYEQQGVVRKRWLGKKSSTVKLSLFMP